MTHPPGTELLMKREGKPDAVFVVDQNEEFALRAFGPFKVNHVDGRAYQSLEIVDLVRGGVCVIEPAARP